MTALTNRPYRNHADLARMLSLVSDATCKDGLLAGHMPVGDVVWGLFQNRTIDPWPCVRLFEDASGVLRGFVWTHAPAFVDL